MAEILEENDKLLGDFIGWEPVKTWMGVKGYVFQEAKFKTDWNWIMPVYKKINDTIDEIGLTNESWHQIAMQDALLEGDIEGVWSNAVALIKEIPLTA